MSILAVYNIKGGVGKTAATVNLAWLSAAQGARTLVWDLDPQAASSFYFRIRPRIKGGAARLVERRRAPARVIKGTDYESLDLLPADFSCRGLDLMLDDTKKPLRRLRKLLLPLSKAYEHLFLDCAPGISLTAESIFYASDVLLVPMIPTTLSLRTFEQLTGFLSQRPGSRPLLLPFFSMVDRRKKLHVDVIESFLRSRPDVLQSYIPYASDVERMGLERAPLGEFAPRSAPARAFGALWREIKARLAAMT